MAEGCVLRDSLLLSAFVLGLLLLMGGCSQQPPKVIYRDVQVPVIVRPEAPAELATPYTPTTLPTFLPPDADGAVVSLDKAGVDALKAILRTLTTRDKAWRAWSTADE